jgi:hypothetical protein
MWALVKRIVQDYVYVVCEVLEFEEGLERFIHAGFGGWVDTPFRIYITVVGYCIFFDQKPASIPGRSRDRNQ